MLYNGAPPPQLNKDFIVPPFLTLCVYKEQFCQFKYFKNKNISGFWELIIFIKILKVNEIR
jgi:hypothetical protein